MISLRVSVFRLRWALGVLLLNEITVNAQRFEAPAIDTNYYGNLSESVDFVWTYTTPDTSRTSIVCIVNLVNIVFKRAGATADIQVGFVGRATVIDDTTSSPYRIGFKLNNLAFSDASNYYCSMTYDGGGPIRSKVYRFQIYERPRTVNCLTNGLMLDNNGVKYFGLREGGVLNSTCYVYGNPVPTLKCRTYDNANNQQAELTEVTRNYTSYPLNELMRFFNVRRAVTKVKCVADGKQAGKLIIERVVRVDYLPSAPRDIKLVKSTPDSIRISWTPPLQHGISRITDYYMELFHPNCTTTMTNYTVLSANPILDYTFNRLFANLEYRIRVSAYNAIGRGEQSNEAKFKTVYFDSTQGKATDTSIGASTIALYTLIPLFLIIIAALLVWIMRWKKKATSIPMTSSNANQNMEGHYMDLELTRKTIESQLYATVANPGALTYEKVPEVKSHYMELNDNRAGNEKHPNSSKDFEVLQK